MCKLRRMAGLLALVVVALALPAAANAGGSHVLKLYKVEKQVDINGDASYDLSCNNGDYATDGMWRVDQVDQDNDIPGNILTQVAVYGAYPDATDKSQYHFEMENLAGGDSQVKLFLTCLGKSSDMGVNSVTFNLGSRQFQQFGYAAGVNSDFFTSSCPANTIAVAPGFETIAGDARLVASRTSLATGEPAVGRNWAMAFNSDGGTTVKRYMRCLDLKSNPGPNGAAHRIVVSRVGGLPSPNFTIHPGDTVEKQSICGELYKGMVHGFDVSAGDAPFEYFFGMDPRIKARAYKFYNGGLGNIKVWTGLTCFKDKTT
jgi:hypothetical protein